MASTGLGVGIYTPGEAARIAQMQPQRVRRWINGYAYKQGEKRRKSPPIFRRDLAALDGKNALTFLDLVEVLFVKAFLQHGVSPYGIRRAAEEASTMFNTNHPFCVKRFETDGRTVIARIVKDDGEERLVDLAAKQTLFRSVFTPLLINLEYDLGTGDATRWWPLGKKKPVVLDPARAFGAAIVLPSTVPARSLAGARRAGETYERISNWFGVTKKEISAAVEFENLIAPHASAA